MNTPQNNSLNEIVNDISEINDFSMKTKIETNLKDLRRRTKYLVECVESVIDSFDKLYNIAFDFQVKLELIKENTSPTTVKSSKKKRQSKKVAVNKLSAQNNNSSENITDKDYTEL